MARSSATIWSITSPKCASSRLKKCPPHRPVRAHARPIGNAADGKIKRDHLVDYVAEVRKLASEKNVPLIDLYALTLAQSETLGPEGSKSLGATTREGKLDTTH